MITHINGIRLLSNHQLWALFVIRSEGLESATDLQRSLNELGFSKSLHNVCALLRQLREYGWVDPDRIVLTSLGNDTLTGNLKLYNELHECLSPLIS